MGVPPEKLQGLMAWAVAERPHVAPVIASGYLSNPAKDWIKLYTEENRPSFRIKWWEFPQLRRLTKDKRDFLDRFLVGGQRSEGELAGEQLYTDLVWHDRKLGMFQNVEADKTKIAPDLLKEVQDAVIAVRALYPDGTIRAVENDFEWGVWLGKLAALRWVLGDEWDNFIL